MRPTRSRRRAQAGFTLIELLVTMALAGIVATAMFGFFFSGQAATRTHESQARAQAAARSAIERFTRDARQAIPEALDSSASPVLSLSATEVVLYVDNRRAASATVPRPQRVRYRVSGTDLVREAADPTGTTAPFTYPSAYSGAEILVSGLAGTAAVFSGVAGDGTPVGGTSDPVALTAVKQLSISLAVSQKTGNASTVTELDADVALRNTF